MDTLHPTPIRSSPSWNVCSIRAGPNGTFHGDVIPVPLTLQLAFGTEACSTSYFQLLLRYERRVDPNVTGSPTPSPTPSPWLATATLAAHPPIRTAPCKKRGSGPPLSGMMRPEMMGQG